MQMIIFILVILVMIVKANAMDARQAQNLAKVYNWLDQPSQLVENIHAEPPVDLNDEDSYSVSKWSYWWSGEPKNGNTNETWMYREDWREFDWSQYRDEAGYEQRDWYGETPENPWIVTTRGLGGIASSFVLLASAPFRRVIQGVRRQCRELRFMGFLVLIALAGRAIAHEFTLHNSGWANWFDDPLAAWLDGRAYQLIHQKDLPNHEWNQYQSPDPPQQLEPVEGPIEVPEEWKRSGSGAPIQYEDYNYEGSWVWENLSHGTQLLL